MSFLLRNFNTQFARRPTQFEQGKSLTMPAPYAGLNLRSDITALQPNEARVLENWLPGSGQLSLRPGFTNHGTDLGSGEVKTLAAFVGYASSKLIACANEKFYDVTTAGAATQLATGFSEDRWQTALYSNRLFFVNGVNTPQVYDGSTVADIAWASTGLTNTNLVNIALVRNRLWFCEKDKAHVWYGAVGQITAASDLIKFQLEQIAGGGYCMAIGSWSRDAGDGADDMTVFVMSTGEIIVYQGDPASTFTLAGKYRTGAPPIGRRCVFNVGGELVVITRLGLLPLSAAVGGVAMDLARIDPWGKIAPGIAADAVLDAENPGWHGCLHDGLVYVSVPQSPGVISKQWVLNTRNGSWTTYAGWNGSSFCAFGDDLYFGAETGGAVNKVGGSDDNGTDITVAANTAFIYPQASQANNLFTMLRPKIQASGRAEGVIGVDTDFVLRSLVGSTVDLVNDPSTTPWGSAWGSPWGTASDSRSTWYTVRGEGRAVSVRMRATCNASDLRWFATDLLFKPGGIR